MSATASASARTHARPSHAWTATSTLVRFILRRDRIRLPVWIGGIWLFTLASVAALPGLYATAADRQARAELIANPTTRAVSGPGYGLDNYTFGAMIGQEYLSWIVVFIALMSIFTVVRHTRTEEETGRAELVRADRVGRHTPLTAALVVAVGANVVLGLLLIVGIGALGIDTIDWSSTVLFAVAMMSVGLVFAAVAAVAVQFTQGTRGANAAAGAVLALAYLLRAAGDMAEVGGGSLSWSSPIGWAQQTRVFVDDRWWPLLLAIGLTVLLVGLAYWLSTRRDVSASLVPTRPGPARATASLSSPLGLAWRLQRTSLAWWAVAMVVFGLGYGSLASEIEAFVAEMSVIEDAIAGVGGTLIDAWLSVIALLNAVLVAVFAVMSTLRARGEEEGGRAEPVLATPVSRGRWLGSHLALALVGSALLQAVAGVGLGLTASQALGDPDLLARVVGATLVHVPAIWLIAAITAALYGLSSRAAPLVWLVIVYVALVGWIGVLLQFPQWALNLSPIGHTPLLPSETMRWTPVVVLLAMAAALVATGLMAFRRRDLQLTA